LAGTVETGGVGPLAEPSTKVDVLELVLLAFSKNLAVNAGVELVLHHTGGGLDGVHGGTLKLGAVGKLLETHLGAPLGDYVHVASSGRSRLGGGLGSVGGLRSGSVCGLRSRSVGGLSRRRGLVCGHRYDRVRIGRLRHWLLDNGGGGGSSRCYIGGGRSGNRVALGDVDGLDDSLDNDVDVLDGLVSVAVTVARSGDGSASKGGDSESGAHVDSLGLVWFIGLYLRNDGRIRFDGRMLFFELCERNEIAEGR
jgi:hypothetical protein